MLHTVLPGLGILLLCGNLWILGDIGWSLPKYHAIPPQYCMWDCLVLGFEKFMLKSWGISQIFLFGVPLFLSLVPVIRLPKCHIAPSWHVRFWPSSVKFVKKLGFHALRPMLM